MTKSAEAIPVVQSDLPGESKKLTCGIIMPIASHEAYPQDHWKDVLNILIEAVNETQFEPKLVSDDVSIGLIHERIVSNIYSNEIVICDVSSKNPNVMFELGLRLAFDKPTLIIKDEKTGYSFDTGVIEHLNYPSSLRFADIVRFKADLVSKLNGTYMRSIAEKDFSPFLKSFGKTIKPSAISPTEVSESQYIIQQLEALRSEFRNARRYPSSAYYDKISQDNVNLDVIQNEIERAILSVMSNYNGAERNLSEWTRFVSDELRKNTRIEVSKNHLSENVLRIVPRELISGLSRP